MSLTGSKNVIYIIDDSLHMNKTIYPGYTKLSAY